MKQTTLFFSLTGKLPWAISDLQSGKNVQLIASVTPAGQITCRLLCLCPAMTDLKKSTGVEWMTLGWVVPCFICMHLSFTEKLPSSYASETDKVLALGVRGPKGISTLQNITGPSDPQLAGMTDCSSINAIYCMSHGEPPVYLPQQDSCVHRELCLWFGGRAADAALHGGILDPTSRCNRTRWGCWPACLWVMVVLPGKAMWRTDKHTVGTLCLYWSSAKSLRETESEGWNLYTFPIFTWVTTVCKSTSLTALSPLDMSGVGFLQLPPVNSFLEDL